MNNYIDKVRAEGLAAKEVAGVGFDPDLDTAGLCYAKTEMYHGSHKLKYIELSTIYRKGKARANSIQRSLDMISAVAKQSVYITFGNLSFVVIEGQEIYADREDTRQALVKKANDLLRIGYVGAAFSGMCMNTVADMDMSLEINIPRPKEWKQNQKKESMHKKAIEKMEKDKPEALYWNKMGGLNTVHQLSDLLQPKHNHAMDALCMCLWKFKKLSARWGV